jgi:hypothetical protein
MEFFDIEYVRRYSMFIPRLYKYPRGVTLPLTDGLGGKMDRQVISVTKKELVDLVDRQKLFKVCKKAKPKMEVAQDESRV